LIFNNVIVEDTFAELFKMWASRVIITADNTDLLQAAINSAIGFATSIIMCPCEAGVDTYLPKDETPDNRIGASIIFFTKDKDSLNHELLKRLSQCILTAPTTALFNGLQSDEKNKVGSMISYFGDGWQRKEIRFGREVSIIPMMDGEFIIENSYGLTEGYAGGNFLILAKNKSSGILAANSAVQEIIKIPFTITQFPGGICRSGSKIGSKYKGLVASINHQYCPILKQKIDDSKLPSDVSAVYEIVINGLTLDAVKLAMLKGIKAAAETKNVLRITSVNYGGKLGPDKIYLKDLFKD
jgi:formylmethanofuran--tetrahydromethanopterin N-formyltransferase